jgi:hypothetical protein
MKLGKKPDLVWMIPLQKIAIFLHFLMRFSTNYPLMIQIYKKILQIVGSFGISFVVE